MKFLQITPIVLMWLPPDTPVTSYLVELRDGPALIKSITRTNTTLMLSEFMEGVPPGTYQMTMTSGTNIYTNSITYPFVDETLNRPQGFHISAQ